MKIDNNISSISDLEFLKNLSLEELRSYEGIGKVKAIQIKALIELSKRISYTYTSDRCKLTTPREVFQFIHKDFIGKKQEILKTIILNKNSKVISVITNAIGNADNINIGIKEVLSEPVKQMASSIILVHNHPGGSLLPSKADINFTYKINEYSKVFDINLLDHIIVSNAGYVSLKEKRII